MKATIHINRLGEYSLRCDESGELLVRCKSLAQAKRVAANYGYEAIECQDCKDNYTSPTGRTNFQDPFTQWLRVPNAERKDPPFGAPNNWSNVPTPLTFAQIGEDLMRKAFEDTWAELETMRLQRAAKMKELTQQCELQAIIVAALQGTTAQLIDNSDTSLLAIYSTYNEDQSVRESWAVSKQGVRALVK